MSSSRTKAVIFTLLLGLVCFLTAPVFSGEGPWDADGNDGSGTTNDTTGTTIEPDMGTLLQGSENPNDGSGGSLLGFFLRTSYQYFLFQFVDKGSTSSAPQVTSKATIRTAVVNQSSSKRIR